MDSLTRADDVRIVEILVDDVSVPKRDGTPGSDLYKIPFRLSRKPSQIWENAFIEAWDNPENPKYSHKPGIASILGDRIILEKTTIEKIERYHQNALKLAVDRANKTEKETLNKKSALNSKERKRIREHRERVEEVAKRIKFE